MNVSVRMNIWWGWSSDYVKVRRCVRGNWCNTGVHKTISITLVKHIVQKMLHFSDGNNWCNTNAFKTTSKCMILILQILYKICCNGVIGVISVSSKPPPGHHRPIWPPMTDTWWLTHTYFVTHETGNDKAKWSVLTEIFSCLWSGHFRCRGAFFAWCAPVLSCPRIMCSQVRMLKFLEPSREMP